ncbi:MAG: methylated-DNA-[protein]-cysteine S-methyltransferase [Thermoleophilaceae bacterium]|jgi:methylated-DNA-[protein]-cysteine S-methyltransferase|nr:methylated-DNA-[protein]-cysteine S-methyltransferase [Thermoleophilaceae bacterium]
MAPFLPTSTDATPRWHRFDSPLGELLLVGDGHALTRLLMEPRRADVPPGGLHDPGAFREPEAQLRGYFEGELTEFDLPLAPAGSDFQLRVWAALLEIPYGETASYGEIAAAVGRPDAFRAVGATNGRNPIGVIVPCHRVIGSDGSLIGYGGGLPRKRMLLELEAQHAAPRLWAGG